MKFIPIAEYTGPERGALLRTVRRVEPVAVDQAANPTDLSRRARYRRALATAGMLYRTQDYVLQK